MPLGEFRPTSVTSAHSADTFGGRVMELMELMELMEFVECDAPGTPHTP